MSQPTQVNIPSELNTTLRDMAARNANLAQEVAMLQGQIQTLLNMMTTDQLKQLQDQAQPMAEPTPALPNRAERRRAAKKTAAKKPVSA